MAKIKTNNNVPIEERLLALNELQRIDSQIDSIQKLKGELPAEVEELENELANLDGRLERIQDEIKELNDKVSKFNAQIAEAEALIQKYDKQQGTIKNNREYESIMQQIELQYLEIQLLQKRIRETKTQIATKEQTADASAKKRDGKLKELDGKREELKKIIVKTEKDEKNLQKQREKARKAIDERTLKMYDRIREFYADGYAVATVDRAACSGCHNQIPPQAILELRQHKRITLCEHCGRVLVDRSIAFPGEMSEMGEEGDFVDFPDYGDDWDE